MNKAPEIPIAELITELAYGKLYLPIESLQQEAIIEFGNKVYLDCMKEGRKSISDLE